MKKIKKNINIKYSDNLSTRFRKFVFALFRMSIYGIIGVFAEVSLYTVKKIGMKIPFLKYMFMFEWHVDDKLKLGNIWDVPITTFYGQCSLWMFLVFGLGTLFAIEWFYRHYYHLKWYVRGIFYSLIIMGLEFISYFILLFITKYQIWYYSDILNILKATSLLTFPLWFFAGLFIEFVYREFMSKEVHTVIRNEIDEALKK